MVKRSAGHPVWLRSQGGGHHARSVHQVYWPAGSEKEPPQATRTPIEKHIYSESCCDFLVLSVVRQALRVATIVTPNLWTIFLDRCKGLVPLSRRANAPVVKPRRLRSEAKAIAADRMAVVAANWSTIYDLIGSPRLPKADCLDASATGSFARVGGDFLLASDFLPCGGLIAVLRTAVLNSGVEPPDDGDLRVRTGGIAFAVVGPSGMRHGGMLVDGDGSAARSPIVSRNSFMRRFRIKIKIQS